MLFFAQFWPGILSAYDATRYLRSLMQASSNIKHSCDTPRRSSGLEPGCDGSHEEVETHIRALLHRTSSFVVGKSCLQGGQQTSHIPHTIAVNTQPVLLLLCSSTLVLGLKLSVGSGLALIGGDDEGSAIPESILRCLRGCRATRYKGIESIDDLDSVLMVGLKVIGQSKV
jgi:hypothetical protein